MNNNSTEKSLEERLKRIEKELEEITNILLAGTNAICEKDSDDSQSYQCPLSYISEEDEPEPHGI